MSIYFSNGKFTGKPAETYVNKAVERTRDTKNAS